MTETCVVIDNATGNEVHMPATRWRNQTNSEIFIELQIDEAKPLDPRLPRHVQSWHGQIFLRVLPDGRLERAELKHGGHIPTVVVPRGVDVLLPKIFDEAIHLEECTECHKGRYCRNAAHKKNLIGGLGPRLQKVVDGRAIYTPSPVRRPAPAPAPLIDPATYGADDDADSRLLERARAGKELTMDQTELIAVQSAFAKAEAELRTREAELESAREAETSANIELDSNESDAALKKATGARVRRESKERLFKQSRDAYDRAKTAHERTIRARAESACEAERAKLDSWTAGLGSIAKELLLLDAKIDGLVLAAARVVTDGRDLHASFEKHAKELGISPEAVEPTLADARRFLRDALTAAREREGREDHARWLASVPGAHQGLDDRAIAQLQAQKVAEASVATAKALQSALVQGANLAATDLATPTTEPS